MFDVLKKSLDLRNPYNGEKIAIAIRKRMLKCSNFSNQINL